MPLVAHKKLPSFDKLSEEGLLILESQSAMQQDIREMHIGLLNMMPDAALEATERQFFRLIGESNAIAQIFVHPFTLEELPRSDKAQEYIRRNYDSFETIKSNGLDALIITGANVEGEDLKEQAFWQPLTKILDWATDNVASTLCSCLASHVVLEYRYGQKRHKQSQKIWGVYSHEINSSKHPLINHINDRFEVPHSRWNSITLDQFQKAGLNVLSVSKEKEVHLATSEDGIRFVFFQGHPEYDTISLLKEYKRDILAAIEKHPIEFPPFPHNYLGPFEVAVLNEFKYRIEHDERLHLPKPDFPEALISNYIDNVWQDSSTKVFTNWIGIVYQITHIDRTKLYKDSINPQDPLGLRSRS